MYASPSTHSLYLDFRNLHVNGVDDLVLYVASSPDEVCMSTLMGLFPWLAKVRRTTEQK